MTNKLIATAGVLSFGLTAVHIFGGGADVHVPILESGLSDLLKGYVSVVWHGVTAALIINSILLLIAARRPAVQQLLTSIVIVHYMAFVVLFLFYGITRLGSVILMPPWIGFLIIVAVAALGLRQSYRADPAR